MRCMNAAIAISLAYFAAGFELSPASFARRASSVEVDEPAAVGAAFDSRLTGAIGGLLTMPTGALR